jgi:hypothetical protein
LLELRKERKNWAFCQVIEGSKLLREIGDFIPDWDFPVIRKGISVEECLESVLETPCLPPTCCRTRYRQFAIEVPQNPYGPLGIQLANLKKVRNNIYFILFMFAITTSLVGSWIC